MLSLNRSSLVLVILLGTVPVIACNAITGNTTRTLAADDDDDDVQPRDTGGGETPTQPESPIEAGSTPPERDAGPVDAGTDAGADATPPVRMPDAACLKATAPQDAVQKVEMDQSPPPIRNGTDLTVEALYTIYGDNALTNVRLDFCTPDGARVDPGGGFNYLGGGGNITRRWQTKNAVKLPVGRSQAQVIADGSPSLKLVWNIDIK